MLVLQMWVIYKDAKDRERAPFTVRRWEIHGGIGTAAEDRIVATDDVWDFATLDLARRFIPAQADPIGRYTEDDPCIVEVWV